MLTWLKANTAIIAILFFFLNAKVQQNVNVAGHTRSFFSLPAMSSCLGKKSHSTEVSFETWEITAAILQQGTFDNTTPSPWTGTSDTLQQHHLGQAFGSQNAQALSKMIQGQGATIGRLQLQFMSPWLTCPIWSRVGFLAIERGLALSSVSNQAVDGRKSLHLHLGLPAPLALPASSHQCDDI